MPQKKKTLTTNFGAPVDNDLNSLTAGEMGPVLIQDTHLVEKLAHFDRAEALALWLYKVAKTRCLMSRRKSKFAPAHNLSFEWDRENLAAFLKLLMEALFIPLITAEG